MMMLEDALRSVGRLCFDTAPIIYFVEANPVYDARVTAIFQKVADALIEGMTSTVTLCEVLTVPIRHGNLRIQQEYRDLLLRSEGFQTLSVSPQIAEQAADLRARYNLRTPDALLIATALQARCDAFLTNDTGLRRVSEIPIIILDDLTL